MSEITGAGNSFGGRSDKVSKEGNKSWLVWCSVRYMVGVMSKINIFYIPKYNYNLTHETTKHRIIGDITTSERRISPIEQKVIAISAEPYHGRCEMDSHADTTVAGKNCSVLRFINRSCDVAPFSDNVTLMRDIPIVTAVTRYTSANGRNYILVFNEDLYIPDMKHALINPNQCQHFGADVQYIPYRDKETMVINSPDE